jgi:chloride channel protein, CIC family
MKRFLKKLYPRLSTKTTQWFERARMTEHTFMIILAIIIGVLGGFGGIGIRWLIKEISLIFFPGTGTFLENAISAPWYLIVIAPIIGGLIVGPIIYFIAPEAKGHGVPEVMESILLKGGMIRPRVAFIKAIASAISIGSGGSVGREGPIVQIGASLGSTIGQFVRIPNKRLKTLVGCGAAAGIAAAFNAPIAGALFAVEIILMDFAVAQFSPIVISSVMATVISHAFQGDFAAFAVPTYQLVSPYAIVFYFILGALCGFASFLFIKTLYFCEDFFDNRFHIPDYFKPAVGGALIGVIALFLPEVMGVGYDSINDALHGHMMWDIAFILIFAKILATSITLGSGGSGGIFAPSLFMGAMLGNFFGTFVHGLFPEITSTPGAFALVAMGGLVAGTTRAPITAIIIVFELTSDYRIILPVMVTCIISTILSSRLSRESIYTLKLLLRNISIKEGTESNVMESIFVKDIYTKEFDPINAADNFSQVINHVIQARVPEFPVVDDGGELKGIISIYDIKDYLYEKDSLKNLLIANDIANTNFEALMPGDNCQSALDKMRKYDVEGLPVIDYDSKKVSGMIWSKDIQHAYNKEIEAREISSNLASSIVMKDELAQIHFMEGYSISEITPPPSFVGKSIKQLNIRARYGVDVLSVKTKEKYGEKIKAIPSPEYVIASDDLLIIAGEIRNINILKNVG